jgi:hypothetical protein
MFIRFAERSLLVALCASAVLAAAAAAPAQAPAPAPKESWQPLFDGKTLTNWKPTHFIGEGPVTVEKDQIVLASGGDMTGITWTGGELPTMDYELSLQAMRVDGRDFFAGITFPVGPSFCSLILGGWGGTVVGLSSIDDMDASENSTSQSREFDNGRWYNVRIRVTPGRIEAWLDDRQIINHEIKNSRVGVRIEMEASKPLGIASWRTKAALRDVKLRRL